MASPDYATANYSIYAIPAFWFIIMVPFFYGSSIIRLANNGQFDTVNPRGAAHQESIQKRVPKAIVAQYERCKAAHANGWENLPLFASAILAANFAGLEAAKINWWSAVFLALRIVFTISYITASTRPYALIRSASWIGSIVCCMTLLIKSGNVVARK